MGDLFFLALAVSRENQLSSRLVEQNRPAVEVVEVRGAKLAAVEERQGEALGEHGAELLHEIEGERRPAGARDVQKAELGIQADALARGAAVGGEERVQERE